ncbi:terpenoid synthase [Coleophoma cylindrospora]|uniref:Terpene synthase n=1 Tax=Coleophoma cylindrospora TaxID=1849047 RepID=A0A3D8SGA4_9HELO|nr:terpenoid synthase [Coleophoma cylindrospora]
MASPALRQPHAESQQQHEFRIPDTLACWPWQRAINPHYEICKRESIEWLESFHAFNPKAQDAFNRCDFPGCRVGADLMNVFFVIDEYTDIANGQETRQKADIVMDSLRNPYKERPSGEWIGGRIVQEFWQEATKTATEIAQRRFLDTFERYTDAVVQQSQDRTSNYIRDISSYFTIRRKTIGAEPSFVINTIHTNVPDELINHPTIERLALLSIDMILIGNDLVSYNIELRAPLQPISQSRGDEGHNLLTVVMQEHGLTLQEAFDWIGRLHNDLVSQFLKIYAEIPAFVSRCGILGPEVSSYVDALGNWVRANDSWSFESERYFGMDGFRVQQEKTFLLLTKHS